MRRRPSLRRRLLRPFRRLTRLQRVVVGAMVVAAVAAGGGLSYVLSYHAAERTIEAAPPLQLGPLPSTRASGAVTAAVPVTTRLVIPTAKIDIRVIQGDGKTVQMHLAMHYPGTDQPGGGSNALFYAHAQPGMFQGLYSLHVGDHIDAIRADGSTLSYHVTAFKKVAFNDRSVLDPTPFEEITLLTCTSYDPYTPRYIVVALPDQPQSGTTNAGA